MTAKRARCPTCKKSFEAVEEREAVNLPFCSERCRLLDLHKWLSGEYSIPQAAPNAGEGEQP